ncbi:MAG: beta-hexosaminidase [Oscillospiraceae bacterium]|nr:beta-hexosaminidase [Oscillospiraceae bacterium]
MVDLRAKPYYLSDEDIAWVENTIASMSAEEKVGQLFWQLTSSNKEEYLQELMEKYHLGGCRYNGMPGQMVLNQNRILQKYAKVPVFIACNPEQGGNGVCPDGTFVSSQVKIGATGKTEYAQAMGRVSGVQIKATGCNMAFAPVADITYNWECEEVLSRAYGNDHKLVAAMAKAYMDGIHETEGVYACAKHFPGNGQDYRDAHISNNVNHFTHDKWMETYGHVYKTLIDGGLDAIMGGHILMPEYMAEINPDINADTIMPGTLCKEIMTDLLRGELGFNGMVVTDASHMVGMTNRMKRVDMLPAAINAGCDMFLFFNDPAEDFETMLNAYNTGIISEERMVEALSRILGLKAAKGMHKIAKEALCGTDEELKEALSNPEFKAIAPAISKDALTLVKYKDEGVLPITPEKYKRIMLVNIKGAETPMAKLMAIAMGGAGAKKRPVDKLCDKLNAKGFEAFVYESPLDKMVKQVEAGGKMDLNLYFAGKNAIADFVSGQDLVISFFDVGGGHPTFGLSKGGGEIPWYVHELPVIGVSVNKPTMLADAPMLRTYINTYDSNEDTLDALVDALLTGKEAFKGTDPIDAYCGMFDTHM